jgi:hypothetical protein
LVSGFGYLALLSISIFFGQGLKGIPVLIYLMGIIGFTFLFSFFGIVLLIALNIDSEILYAIVNSLFVAVAITFGLNRAVRIDFKFYTIILTFILLFLGNVIIYLSDDFFSHNFNLSPRIVMYSVFQIALILPLALGMAVKKTNTEN